MLTVGQGFAPRVVFAWGFALALGLCAAPATAKGPWDLEQLAVAPAVQWGDRDSRLQAIHFVGPPRDGKPTQVFAYYARPAGEGPFPAMVLLHGGGGKAFAEWAQLWAERGYVALAIDLAGHGQDGQRLKTGGPDQDDQSKFGKFDDAGVREMWTYHAVADALLGHSLLAAQPEVDKQRIGVTGISWGGYLTCIVAGVDPRFQVAVPVYGCGFLDKNSCWIEGHFNKMDAEQRSRWVKNFDPSSYLADVRCPILFVNGTNDFAYPLDSYQASYELVPEKLRNLCITVNMPHGHQAGWAPREIGLFVDSVLKDGAPLAKLGPTKTDGKLVTAKITRQDDAQPVTLASAQLHYTTDVGPWQQRAWTSVAATIQNDEVRAALPRQADDKAAPRVFFFTVRDQRGATVSSPHLTLAP